MTLTLIKRDRLHSLQLPEKIKGQYWLSDIINNSSRRLLEVEALGGQWQLRGSANAYPLSDTGKGARTLPLRPGSLTQVYLPKERQNALLVAEEDTEDRLNFHKYVLQTNQGLEIIIGRDSGSGIVYSDQRVSDPHASLLYLNGHWSIKDQKSTNGTFVNQLAVPSGPLAPGDTIYIMGLTIIIGSNFIAVNNPGGKVSLDKTLFRPYQPEAITAGTEDDNGIPETGLEYYYRSPRFRNEVPPLEITVDPPPQEQPQEEQSLALVLGPSLTMGAASVVMAWFSVTSAMQNGGDMTAAIPSIAMAASMLLGTVLWPILSSRFEKKKRAKKQADLKKRYSDYLRETDETIQAICGKQEKALRESAFSPQECAALIRKRDSRLWERADEQDDFLSLCVGTGDSAPAGEVKYPEQHFEAEDSELRDELHELREKPRLLRNIPVHFSLAQNRVTAVVERRNKCLDFADALLVQLCALYGYDEVKTVFLYDAAESERFGFAKWLPHCWADDRSFRYIATDANEVKTLSQQLEQELVARQPVQGEDQKPKAPVPHFVIFAFSRELALKAEILKKIYDAEEPYGFSVLCFFDTMQNAPKECGTFIELKGGDGKIFHQEDRAGGIVTFTDPVSVTEDMRELALKLANIPLDLSGAYQMPTLVTFMEMFEAGRVEQLNPFVRWQENDPTKSLRALVGVGAQGDPFYIDLHEEAHGPHGLVAGMTGSGKSEFIMTYILSLALNYHPRDVAFLLIDYKGGGMANTFKQLPHVQGVITNLDGAAISRSLISLDSELKRRQKIFDEANRALGVSNIDIYRYQGEYRAGNLPKSLPALPHLFIISDEFAELKDEQKEFMALLIRAARIGRSLGVHLILATQKPAGVVDDQIWSNSRCRVCLKVQDKQDSVDMIKRADAAELKNAGRFYMLVGYNELFLLGQSAWAGAPYIAKDESMREETSCAISLIDRSGRPLQTIRPPRPKTADGKTPPKQLDEIKNYIVQAVIEDEFETYKLWLEPMDAMLLLQQLKEAYALGASEETVLCPLVGECDDPANRRRLPLYLPLSQEGNAIIYGSAGNGKTTLLTTLIYDLLCGHSAKTLNLYIVDFGAQTLQMFGPAPQVGDVMISSDGEKIINLLKYLQKQIALRKKQFSLHGGDYASFCRTVGAVPNIVTVIHNYALFKEMFEDWEDLLASLAMEGTKYGVYFIVTATTTNIVRYHVAQNFNQVLVLRLHDETEYPSILGRTGGVLPARHKGRGLVKKDQVYEFQTAHIQSTAEAASEDIHELCTALRDMHEGEPAPRIPILPARVDTEFLAGEPVRWERLPVGVNRQRLSLEHLDFSGPPIKLISAVDGDYIPPVAQGIAELLAGRTDTEVVVLDPDGLFAPDEKPGYKLCSGNVSAELLELLQLLGGRHVACKEEHEAFPRLLIVIPSLAALFAALSEELRGHLRELLLHCRAELNAFVLFGDEIRKLNGYEDDEWYKAQQCRPELWVGDGAGDNSYVLGLSRIGRDLDDLPPPFGLIIRKGKYTVVKLLHTTMETEDAYDA